MCFAQKTPVLNTRSLQQFIEIFAPFVGPPLSILLASPKFDWPYIRKPSMTHEIHNQNYNESLRLVWLAVVTLTFILINSIPPIVDYLTFRGPDAALGEMFFLAFYFVSRLVQHAGEKPDRVFVLNFI